MVQGAGADTAKRGAPKKAEHVSPPPDPAGATSGAKLKQGLAPAPGTVAALADPVAEVQQELNPEPYPRTLRMQRVQCS
jgi:hypothetical protein